GHASSHSTAGDASIGARGWRPLRTHGQHDGALCRTADPAAQGSLTAGSLAGAGAVHRKRRPCLSLGGAHDHDAIADGQEAKPKATQARALNLAQLKAGNARSLARADLLGPHNRAASGGIGQSLMPSSAPLTVLVPGS